MEGLILSRKEFLDRAELVPPPWIDEKRIDKDSYWDYIWEHWHKKDFKHKFREMNNKHHVYTVIDDVNKKTVLIKGIAYFNRMGYLISKVDVPLPDNEIEL